MFRFEFISRVAHNRLAIAIIERLVTTLASLFVHMDFQTLLPAKNADPADELLAGHGLIMRSVLSAVKHP